MSPKRTCTQSKCVHQFEAKANSLPLITSIVKDKNVCYAGKICHFRFKFPTPHRQSSNSPSLGVDHSQMPLGCPGWGERGAPLELMSA